MTEYSFRMRCPGCGALNRLRLPAGKKVIAHCGKCGEALPLNRRKLFVTVAGNQLKAFFTHGLPMALLAVVEAAVKVIDILAGPVRLAWKRLPKHVQHRLGWGLIALCVAGYFLLEGSIRLGTLLLMALILAAATLIMLLAVRGPDAVARMLKGRAVGGLVKTCEVCGHRFFGWLKHCPRCQRT